MGGWVLVGYLVERSEADLAAPLLGLVAGRSRRGSHDHEKQEHPETGELVAAWKIKKGKVKRKEKGKEAYGWMNGYLTSQRQQECARARLDERERGEGREQPFNKEESSKASTGGHLWRGERLGGGE